MKPGDIIQITNKANNWYPCLVVVSKMKPWGIQGYITLPEGGNAYTRIDNDDFEPVGKAVIVVEN